MSPECDKLRLRVQIVKGDPSEPAFGLVRHGPNAITNRCETVLCVDFDRLFGGVFFWFPHTKEQCKKVEALIEAARQRAEKVLQGQLDLLAKAFDVELARLGLEIGDFLEPEKKRPEKSRPTKNGSTALMSPEPFQPAVLDETVVKVDLVTYHGVGPNREDSIFQKMGPESGNGGCDSFCFRATLDRLYGRDLVRSDLTDEERRLVLAHIETWRQNLEAALRERAKPMIRELAETMQAEMAKGGVAMTRLLAQLEKSRPTKNGGTGSPGESEA